MLSAKETKLLAALEPRAADENVEIVTVEIVGARRAPTIRIYIDTPNGVSFDELSAAQDWIGDIVERLDPFPGAYHLEVSSPGIDRPLRTPEHFMRFTGQRATIKTSAPLDGRSSWTGELGGFQNDEVLIDVEGDTHAIPFENIKRAHLIGTVDFHS